jgi:hypothetical protein
MTMAMTNYLENKLLEAVVKNTAYTTPTTVYLALFSTAPTDSTSGTELSGSGYSRQAITFGTAANGTITSNATATFSTATGNWSTIVATGIMDASTSGNLLFYKTTAGRNIKTNDQLTVAAGDITITLD